MQDLKDGESVEIQGSARKPYVLKNIGGVSNAPSASSADRMKANSGKRSRLSRSTPPRSTAISRRARRFCKRRLTNTNRRMRAFFSRTAARVLTICGKNWRGSSHWGAKD